MPPPVSRAFYNTLKYLKPGGVFLFTVPYSLEKSTQEHYPDLCDYAVQEHHGTKILVNRTTDGEFQLFSPLIFHGGEGETLELRLFSEEGLRKELRDVGFDEPIIYRDSVPDYGIIWNHEWSLPMTIRRPQ